MKDAVAALGASSGNLREKFRREFDAFWNEPGAQRRPIATRDYILRAICPKLYGMHAVKLGMMLVLIGGASIPLGNDADFATDVEVDGEAQEEEYDDDAPVAFNFGGSDDDDDDHDDGNDINSTQTQNNPTHPTPFHYKTIRDDEYDTEYGKRRTAEWWRVANPYPTPTLHRPYTDLIPSLYDLYSVPRPYTEIILILYGPCAHSV